MVSLCIAMILWFRWGVSVVHMKFFLIKFHFDCLALSSSLMTILSPQLQVESLNSKTRDSWYSQCLCWFPSPVCELGLIDRTDGKTGSWLFGDSGQGPYFDLPFILSVLLLLSWLEALWGQTSSFSVCLSFLCSQKIFDSFWKAIKI